MSDTSLIFNLLAVDRVTGVLGGVKGAFGGLALGVGIAAAAAGDHMLHMAGDFQQGMTRLVTGAGEVQSNMHLVSQGILDLAGQVGESTKDLAAGMYLVESAGFHGAAGLNVLKIAAQGAKVGNADMATVADAVTTALNAYHIGADGAAAATNALIAAEGQGKTNLEALAGSLSTVAPIASLAHVSLNELVAAMATMTAQGTPAADAATYLKQTIGQLSNPTAKARAEMKALGLDATAVSMNLGKNGLASTLTMLTDAITAKMGPAGTVLIETLRKASGNATQFQTILANLPPTQQTFIGALATMVGGTKSMQAALELTGANMQVFQHNTDVINEKVKAGGSTIEGWSLVQKNFNQRMAEARGTVEALSIRIGTALLPAAQNILHVTMDVVTWFGKHKDVALALAVVIGGITTGFLIYKTAVLAISVATKVWTAAQWLLNLAMDANPVGLVIIAIAAIAAGVYLLWTHSKGFRDFFIGAWHVIWDTLKAIGGWFAGPFAQFFVAAAHAVAAPFIWLWQNVLYPGWQAISLIIGVVMQVVTSFINLFLYLGNGVIQPIWQTIIKPVFEAIGATAVWLWQNVLYPAGQAIGLVFHTIGDVANWLWHNALEPTFKGIGAVFSWLWNTIINPVFTAVKGAVHEVGDVFKSVFGAIGGFVTGAFHNVVGIIKGALNAVIGVLNSAIGFINNNLIDKANKVPGVNFPHIPNIPYLAAGGDITRGGMAMVGERGPEVVSLPTGARVHPAGSGAAGSQVVEVRFKGNTDSTLATMLHTLQRQGILQFALTSPAN